MQNETLVAVNDVSRWYGDQCVVKNIQISLKRGEVLGFLGANGAGKSTTMNIITGNLAPTTGEIRINGIDLFDSPAAAKRHIGYLPEQPPLYKNFTVDEYLQFCAQIKGVSKSNIRSAMGHAKERCGLTKVAKRLIANLSKGYQQRVGIAQAILHSPSVVILDEPTVGLDPIQIKEIRQLIRDLGEDRSVILSSHILPEIQSTCNRVQIIHEGELVFQSDMESIEKDQKYDCLKVRFENPPAAKELEALHQVHDIEMLEDGYCKIFFEPEDNPSKTIVQASVSNHWDLLELVPVKKSLEQIFVDITGGDVVNKDEAA